MPSSLFTSLNKLFNIIVASPHALITIDEISSLLKIDLVKILCDGCVSECALNIFLIISSLFPSTQINDVTAINETPG